MDWSIGGIYWIRNKINNKIYIGSSKNMEKRKRTHFTNLDRNNHKNQHLQSSYDRYGKDSFIFEILLYCPADLLLWYEQQFIDKLKPEYNISKYAGSPMRGRKHSRITKEKMSLATVGRKYPQFEASWKNPYYKGKHLSDSTKEKIRLAMMGKHPTAASRLKQSNAQKGWVHNCKTYIGLISPDGTVYKNIINMAKFGREHNISGRHIMWVLSNHDQYKGWKLYEEVV